MVRLRIILVIAAVLLAVSAAGAYAATPPFETNSECLECHDLTTGSGAFTRVDFTVPAVDYANCDNCHYLNGSGGDHWHQTTTCATCHYGLFPSGTPYSSPQVDTEYGYFDNAGSLMASAESLHDIHTGGNWVDGFGMDPALMCSNCHAPAGCDACHTGVVDHTDHAGASVAPVPYRNTTGFSSGVRVSSITCVNDACHSLANAASADFVPPCASCHPANTATHGYDTVDHVADNGSDADPGATTCDSCHDTDLMTEHEKTTSSSAGGACDTCHPTPRDTFAVWNQSCEQGGCHEVGSATERHVGMDAVHVPAPAGAVCLECHPGPGLPDMHSTAETTTPSGTYGNCNVCHNPDVAAASNDCTVCHFTFDDHYDSAKHLSSWTLDSCDDSGCHSTRDLMGAHTEKNAAFECADCHDSTDPSVENAIATGDTACDACHTGVTETEGHRAVHWANPPLLGGNPPTPNYSYYTGSAGVEPTTDCAMCHVSNLVDEHLGVFEAGQWTRPPRHDPTGDELGCPTCHASLDAAVGTAIALNQTHCDACHVVHGPIDAVHESAFVDDPPLDCSDCHNASLSAEHVGVVVTTSTGTLSGCEMCHEYYEGARGAEVQAAISADNDTRCTACHADYHASSMSHVATDPDSVDGCGSCHGATAGELDVQTVHMDASEGPCDVCHANPARVPDITAVTAECSSCHADEGVDYHRNIDALHGAPDSQECVDCHETADVRDLHGADAAASCAVCHDGVVDTSGTTACMNCHDYSPADPMHYDPMSHIASEPTECSLCHYSELKPEHFKTTAGPVGCVECHEVAVDGLIVAWDGTCAQCHVVRHQDTHASHTTSNADCTQSGCHATDLTWVHQALPGYGCPTCHSVDELPVSDDCAVCHTTYHAGTEVSHTAVDFASEDCGRCHDDDGAVGVNVEPVHVGAAEGSCSVCHDNPARVPDITVETAECASCHAVAGTEYHRNAAAAHTFGAMDPSCVDAGCHAADTLPEAHEPYMTGYPQYADTCELCHLNDDSQRIDWATASADCSTCHEVHGDIEAIHQAPDSQECVDCHETTDVRSLHGADAASSCVVCHNGTVDTSGTTGCTNCHDYSPVDPAHYDPGAHTASESGDCSSCHYLEMKPEHFKASSGPVSCVQCHEIEVDAFTGAWDETCMACHDVRHAAMGVSHVSANNECGGSGCHAVGDVADIHSDCTYCHESRDTIPTSTDCADCHFGEGHELREPMATCVGSGCHSSSEIHDEGPHRNEDCASCHGEAADGCVAQGCHDFDEVHEEGDHPNDCEACHTSGVTAPHGSITSKLTTDSSWRSACDDCHGRFHRRRNCASCHSIGERQDVHDESDHLRNSACDNCHNVSSADQSLDCVMCHSGSGSSDDDSSDGGHWGDGRGW